MIRIGISGCGAVAQLYYRPALHALCASGERVGVAVVRLFPMPGRSARSTICWRWTSTW